MSQLMLEELARDEAPRNARVRIGHDWTWPEVVALIVGAAVVGFCVGILIGA